MSDVIERQIIIETVRRRKLRTVRVTQQESFYSKSKCLRVH